MQVMGNFGLRIGVSWAWDVNRPVLVTGQCLGVCAQPCISKQKTLPLVAMLRTTLHDHLRQLSIGAVLIHMYQYWVVSMPCFSLYIEQNKAFDKLWRWLVISDKQFHLLLTKAWLLHICHLDSARPMNLGSRLYYFSTQGRGRYNSKFKTSH